MKPFRILSLDGGGSWALIQIRILQNLFGKNTNGHDVLKNFDMAVANSGGSLALAAMADGKTLEEIAQIFLNEKLRNSVFSELGFFEKSFLNKILNLIKIGPKYSAERKLKALNILLPNISNIDITQVPELIGRNDLKIVICTYDYEQNRAAFFRSDKNSVSETVNLERKWGINAEGKFRSCTLVQAVHAASNAPLNYFNKPAKFVTNLNGTADSIEKYYWDGAVAGNNNPVHVGIIEALNNGTGAEQIQVFSIGTGSVNLPIETDPAKPLSTEHSFLIEKRKKQKFKDDLLKMTVSILSDPPDTASFIAYTFLNPSLDNKKNVKFIRANPLIQPVYSMYSKKWECPPGFKIDEFYKLINLDMDATKQSDVELIDKLASLYLENNLNNQPIRRGSGKMNCVIGQNNWDEVKKLWKTF
ncbi:MAG: patatin-like phospholipase family protein [Bacteroidetes bacterium]|nr:patatin-like phospholipase family protein [Bacteroidota bacterium]